MKTAVYICSSLTSPYLERTLVALKGQVLPTEWKLFQVVLVVNISSEQEERNNQLLKGIKASFEEGGAQMEILFESSIGIPFARNAALEHAALHGVDFVAFIDDDCIPRPDWLAKLLEPVVGGFSNASAGSWEIVPDGGNASPFVPKRVWGRKDYVVKGERAEDLDLIPHAYTRSVLFDRKFNSGVEEIRFDTSRAELGGSDVLFFDQFTKQGGSIRYARSSVVSEIYSGDRVKLGWHFWRRWRNAQFVLERSRMLGELIYVPRSILGLPFALLLLLSGARVKLYRPRRERRFSIPRLSPAILGFLAFRVAQVFAVLAMDVGVRHHNYRRRGPRTRITLPNRSPVGKGASN